MARGDDAFDILAAVAPADGAHRFAPDVALLELAVTALDHACPPGAEPLEDDGPARALPARGDVPRPGRASQSQYALHAAACMRGGLQPDLLSETCWWETPLW